MIIPPTLLRFTVITIVMVASAHATTFFVAHGGSDFNPGTQSQPFQTIQMAINTATAGDSVSVSAGIYNETVNFNRSGTSGARITVTASGVAKIGGAVSLTGSYCTLDGFQCGKSSLPSYGSPAFAVLGSNNILQNCIVDSIPNAGPYGSEATAFDLDGNNNLIYKCTAANLSDTDAFRIFGDRNVIDSCLIHDSTNPHYNTGAHADVFQSWGGMTNCLIQNCLCYNIQHQLGILATGPGGNSTTVNNNTFRNNVIINSEQFFTLQTNFHCYNNTFYQCSPDLDAVLFIDPSLAGCVYKNNVFYGCGGGGGNNPFQGGFKGSTGGITIDHNYFANTDFSPKNSVIGIGTNAVNGGNPRFVNPAAKDVHIQSGSVLIAGGANITPNFADKDGNARPFSGSWDIGAYEYTSGTSLPSPPPISKSGPQYVQGAYSTPQSPQSTVSVPFPSAQRTGDLNVVVVGWNDASTQVSSVTDTIGNSYSLAVGPTRIAGGISQSIYYAPISQSANGANMVTVTFASGAVYPDIRVMEFSGIDTSNPVAAVAQGTGNSNISNTAALTTTQNNDLLVSANTVLSFTSAPGAPFVKRLITQPDGDIAQDTVLSAAGSYSATAPLRFPGIWVMQAVAFRSANP